MKKIDHKGNLPKILQHFAVQLSTEFSGEKETEFWECSSVSEFEKNAEELEYEIVPTMDMATDRGYLVGFSAEEPKEIKTLKNYMQLKMYFIELDSSEFNSWVKKIKHHRELQEQDAFLRRQK